jgi:hypothetical protein
MSAGVPAMFDRELLVSVRDIPILVQQRGHFLYRSLQFEFGSTLEIGALHIPTIRPGECETHFLDRFQSDELRERHRDNPKVNVDDLVTVDHVNQIERLRRPHP